MPESADITAILIQLDSDPADRGALIEALFDAVYADLKDIASGLMRRERSDHTLRPTALVHEAYLRIAKSPQIGWKERRHFLGVATRAMRQVLVDHARRHDANKRGGGLERVTVDGMNISKSPEVELQILELDAVLDRLEALSARMARVAELRIFGGLTLQEVADIVGVSRRTAAGDWSVARRWIGRELVEGGSP